ncbi:hypothetical protein O1L60_23990 [Streptomyces diastatochromogenes]|nr:hypothetical protein [Streptomyces diastatochromogenes]
MADERYQWLDQEAAERLLRGEPVEAVDDHARVQAERLAEALGTARVPAVPPSARTELPGEAAALAAFRAATAERTAAVAVTAASASAVAPDSASDAASASASASAGRTGAAELGRVRLAPSPTRRAAGDVPCGTGWPPRSPPSRSAASPSPPVRACCRWSARRPPAPSRPRGRRTRSSPRTPAYAGTPGRPRRTRAAATPRPARPLGRLLVHGPDPADPGRTRHAHHRPGHPEAGQEPRRPGRHARRRLVGGPREALQACRSYRTGRLDATGRQQITNALRDGETLRGYCDRILSGGTGTPTENDQDDSRPAARAAREAREARATRGHLRRRPQGRLEQHVQRHLQRHVERRLRTRRPERRHREPGREQHSRARLPGRDHPRAARRNHRRSTPSARGVTLFGPSAQ